MNNFKKQISEMLNHLILLTFLLIEFKISKDRFSYFFSVINNFLIILSQTFFINYVLSFFNGEILHFLTTYNLYKILNFEGFEFVYMIIIYFCFYDFTYYWIHRFEHKNKYLWFLHHLHHSDKNLSVATSSRNFWLEYLLGTLFSYVPIILIFGLDFKAMAIVTSIRYFWTLLIHSQFKISFGWFNKIFVSPQIHRIHHSEDKIHLNKNFAMYISLYDVIFGTYYDPQKEEYPMSGINNDTKIINPIQSVYYPFVLMYKSIMKN